MERPILFNGEMVRAVLDGRKTQTRRAVKLIPQDKRTILCSFSNEKGAIFNDGRGLSVSTFVPIRCPYGQPGDRLWVREAWKVYSDNLPPRILYPSDGSIEAVDFTGDWDFFCEQYAKSGPNRTRPSIHMWRWASRITLEITDVRVERVQDISARDVESEGVDVVSRLPVFPPKRETLECLLKIVAHQEIKKPWDSINAKCGYSWDSNPWVWAISFKVVK